jgi:thymidylate synthase
LIEKMLEQPVYDAPEFVMDKSVKDFYAFNTTHFKLENYRYNDFEVKPEVAV